MRIFFTTKQVFRYYTYNFQGYKPIKIATKRATAANAIITKVGAITNFTHLLKGIPARAITAINAPLVGTNKSMVGAPY